VLKNFRKDIESIGFEVNPYYICVANRMVNGKQHTITWHVDDVNSSHVDPKVNDEFHTWCEQPYGSEETGHVTMVHGKRHDCLAMILDYSVDGALKVDMKVKVNVIYQDNTSMMKLAQNGKASSGKRTRHFDIKMFYVTDLIHQDECMVKYCPTDDMIADYKTNPLVGNKFKVFRDLILNLSGIIPQFGQQECVGHN